MTQVVENALLQTLKRLKKTAEFCRSTPFRFNVSAVQCKALLSGELRELREELLRSYQSPSIKSYQLIKLVRRLNDRFSEHTVAFKIEKQEEGDEVVIVEVKKENSGKMRSVYKEEEGFLPRLLTPSPSKGYTEDETQAS